MKRTLKYLAALALAASLLTALAAPAMAAWGTRYVNRSKVKVYAEDDTDSKVLKTYKGGREVTVDAVSPDGKWAQVTVNNDIAFIQMKYLSEDIPQEYCDHNWRSWEVTKEATCTKKGERQRFCPVCGAWQTQEIKKKGHDWGKWKVTKEATCARQGTRKRVCKVCGEEEQEKFYEEHTFGAWSMTREPTCTFEGQRARTCKVCGERETQALDKLPHDYGYEITVQATDHSAGVRSKICQVCGANGGEESFDPEGTLRRGQRGQEVRDLQQQLVDQGYLNVGGADGMFGGGTEKALIRFQKDQGLTADGVAWPQTIKRLRHDFGPWTTVKEMTRTEPGERVRVCRDCGFEQRETVEAGTVFEKGRRGDDVRALQQIIKQVGYDAGGFDGIYGRKLDAAMAGFAADHGLTVQAGKIRPGDLDAVVNAWLEAVPANSWKAESASGSPVSLALTVTREGEPDESGIATYSWSLTNLGSQRAMFNALLLTFGDNPDFRHDNMVMALNGFELKGNAKNSVSGSFSADSDWGKGDLHFAAMAVTDRDGAKWLSNVVTFENADADAARTVVPLENRLDVSRLPDGEYAVSFDPGDVFSGRTGVYMNGVHIYTEDRYAAADAEALKPGDTIVVEGEEVPVLNIDRTNGITVNDGEDARAFDLVDEGDGTYSLRGLNGLTVYTDQGVTTLVVSDIATFSDAWEFESLPNIVGYNDIAQTMRDSENTYFVQYNTTVRMESGKVVDINRVYVP